MARLIIRRTISICLILSLSLAVIAELSLNHVWAKDIGGSIDLEGKTVIMGKGIGYVVIGEKHFLLAKNLTIKDKKGKEIPLRMIKLPVKAFIRYSLRVEDNVPTLKSIDLLE